jgi:hypothetical protein
VNFAFSLPGADFAYFAPDLRGSEIRSLAIAKTMGEFWPKDWRSRRVISLGKRLPFAIGRSKAARPRSAKSGPY